MKPLFLKRNKHIYYEEINQIDKVKKIVYVRIVRSIFEDIRESSCLKNRGTFREIYYLREVGK